MFARWLSFPLASFPFSRRLCRRWVRRGERDGIGWGCNVRNRLHGRKSRNTWSADLTWCIYPRLCLSLTFHPVALHSSAVIGMLSCVILFACLNMHDINMSSLLSGLTCQHLVGCNHLILHYLISVMSSLYHYCPFYFSSFWLYPSKITQLSWMLSIARTNQSRHRTGPQQP